MVEIKKTYEILKKKYHLPEYTEFNTEFEISTIEKDDFLLAEIRKKIDDKIELFVKILDRILQPDTCIADMREQRAFNDEDKKELFEVYRNLQIMHKNSLLLAIEENEKENAEFINSIWKDWMDLKKVMIETVIKLRDSWKGDIKYDEETNYLG